MKLKRLFAVLLFGIFFCMALPVYAKEVQGSGGTTIGYQTSTGGESSSGEKENGKGNVKTGDDTDLAKGLLLFGVSGSLLIFLLQKEYYHTLVL